jgi:hypothetical protein
MPLFKHIVTCQSDYRRGFDFDIGFIDHYNILLVITPNFSAIGDFHTLPNHAKSFPARSLFTSSYLVTASNNGYSCASVLKSSLDGGSLPNASPSKVRVTLRLAVYRQSVCLGVMPLENHDQISFFFSTEPLQ